MTVVGLPGGHTAVDAEGLAGDEGGFLAAKVEAGMSDIVGSSPALHGDEGVVGIFFGLGIQFMAFDGDPAGGDGIDGDVPGGEFAGHAA